MTRSLSDGTQDDVADAIFGMLYGLSGLIDEQSREIERLTGLSRHQALTIRALAHAPGMTVLKLAHSLYLNPATMVRVLNGLEERGLVRRTRSKTDRRVVEIDLTEKAKDTEHLLRKVSRDSLTKLFGPAGEGNLAVLLNSLKDVLSRLEVPAVPPERGHGRKPMKGR